MDILTALVDRCPDEDVDADGVGLHIQLESVHLKSVNDDKIFVNGKSRLG